MKHLSGQRSHLGADAAKRQATIFCAACFEKALALKVEKVDLTELWNDDHLDFQHGLENSGADEANGVVPAQNPQWLSHAWREDWEKISSKTKDTVHETQLLPKYSGLQWMDPDANMMIVADPQNLEWLHCLGWFVIGITETGEMEWGR